MERLPHEPDGRMDVGDVYCTAMDFGEPDPTPSLEPTGGFDIILCGRLYASENVGGRSVYAGIGALFDDTCSLAERYTVYIHAKHNRTTINMHLDNMSPGYSSRNFNSPENYPKSGECHFNFHVF